MKKTCQWTSVRSLTSGTALLGLTWVQLSTYVHVLLWVQRVIFVNKYCAQPWGLWISTIQHSEHHTTQYCATNTIGKMKPPSVSGLHALQLVIMALPSKWPTGRDSIKGTLLTSALHLTFKGNLRVSQYQACSALRDSRPSIEFWPKPIYLCYPIANHPCPRTQRERQHSLAASRRLK